ncbi:Do family serine endopeptidase [Beijerinckia sp. L45]|uniref:Do family serine endopeptidase n=1 Tax=Beijerinckia sp. L45 TaxID=1641855 RepID=UPI00131BF3F4|nr:Do family serine endopeptidase [Beijerinckia sp. L45]
MVSQNTPEFDQQPTSKRTGFKTRAALLGAVGVLALSGAVVNGFVPANAEAPAVDSASQEHSITVNPTSFADVVDHVRSAVVSVKVKVTETTENADGDGDGDSGPQQGMPQLKPGDPLERFFKQFGEKGGSQFQKPNKPHSSQAQGSGFFISPDGYLVTNNHVVEHATDVQLVTDDGKTLPAKVIGTDKKTDLALLKVTEKGTFPFVKFAEKAPRVGDWVIAVGNPFGLGGTVTAGIVSARGRDIGAGPYDDFLQIDAPVNRGNSGGPTFNGAGQVVGVNTAIFSPSGGSVGIGFAIPAEVAQTVIRDLETKGAVSRGWIGVQIQPVTSEIAESLGLKSNKGALVAEAQSTGPAAAAGIKSGDVILGVDGEKVDGPRELARKIASLGPEAKAQLTFWHDGAEKQASVKLGTLPNSDQVAKADVDNDTGKSMVTSLGLQLAPAASIPGAGKVGVVVADVDPEGAAAQKGLKVGDIILEAGGQAVTSPNDITSAITAAKKDGRKAILLRVKSEQGTRFVAISTNPAG